MEARRLRKPTITAGLAMLSKSFPLKSGGELRIASGPITLGDGSAIPSDGLKPDIDVSVRAEEERVYYADAFYSVRRTNAPAEAAAGTNAAARRVRLNEAQLVREHREGLDRETGETPRERQPEPEAPVVSDPALARALDLLKGLAVVRQSRS